MTTGLILFFIMIKTNTFLCESHISRNPSFKFERLKKKMFPCSWKFEYKYYSPPPAPLGKLEPSHLMDLYLSHSLETLFWVNIWLYNFLRNWDRIQHFGCGLRLCPLMYVPVHIFELLQYTHCLFMSRTLNKACVYTWKISVACICGP